MDAGWTWFYQIENRKQTFLDYYEQIQQGRAPPRETWKNVFDINQQRLFIQSANCFEIGRSAHNFVDASKQTKMQNSWQFWLAKTQRSFFRYTFHWGKRSFQLITSVLRFTKTFFQEWLFVSRAVAISKAWLGSDGRNLSDYVIRKYWRRTSNFRAKAKISIPKSAQTLNIWTLELEWSQRLCGWASWACLRQFLYAAGQSNPF